MSLVQRNRIIRALISLGTIAVAYGIAAEIANRVLPHRIWMDVHYIEGVELLPTYRSLAEEMAFLLQSWILPDSILVSTGRILAGLVLGSIVGIAVGLATGRAARLEYLAEPWMMLLRFTPALALLPLYVIWFGYGEASKILLIASSVAVVTMLGAHHAVRGVPQVYLDAARALGADPRLIFRKVILPAAFPQIFASLRVALGLAWVTIVVAELIDAKMPSLGYLLALAGAYPRVPQMLIGLGTIAALVFLSDMLALSLHAKVTRWMRRTG